MRRELCSVPDLRLSQFEKLACEILYLERYLSLMLILMNRRIFILQNSSPLKTESF